MSPESPTPDARFVGPLPRNWERAFGYEGDARWLIAYWTPAGDEAVYDDGRVFADGAWWIFSDLVDHTLARALVESMAGVPRGRFALGSSEERATHCLLLDLWERWVYVAPLGEAEEFVRAQWPPEPVVSAEDVEALIAALREALEEASRERTSFRVCDACFGGWIKAADGGYDPCPTCGGGWLIPVAAEVGRE